MKSNQINLDLLKRDSWSNEERRNAEFVIEFVQKIMNDHDFEYVKENFGSNPYRQHNQSMIDGIEGVIQSMEQLTSNFPDFSYEVKHVYVDSEFVIVQSHATLSKEDRGNPQKGLNIYDTWKVVNNQIVEHWDAIQGIDQRMRKVVLQNGGQFRNDNTYF